MEDFQKRMLKHDSKLKIFGKNCPSSTDESEKEIKNARHPWMKAKKR